jgi:hypothetical protein
MSTRPTISSGFLETGSIDGFVGSDRRVSNASSTGLAVPARVRIAHPRRGLVLHEHPLTSLGPGVAERSVWGVFSNARMAWRSFSKSP